MRQVRVVMLQTQYYHPYGSLIAGSAVLVNPDEARRWTAINVAYLADGETLPPAPANTQMNKLLKQAAVKNETARIVGSLIWSRYLPPVLSDGAKTLSLYARRSTGAMAQGETRAYWNGPAGRHPGYALAVGMS